MLLCGAFAVVKAGVRMHRGLSGKQSLDLSMEYYVCVQLKMVTMGGPSSLFSRKQEEVDLNQVDQIEYVDKDKKIACMNLKVTDTSNGIFDVALRTAAKKRRFLSS